MPKHGPFSEQERQRQREEVERKVKAGEMPREAGQKLLDSLKSPNILREG